LDSESAQGVKDFEGQQLERRFESESGERHDLVGPGAASPKAPPTRSTRVAQVGSWVRGIDGNALWRIHDLVIPLAGMYVGQFLVVSLPRSLGWGLVVIAVSAILLGLRLRSATRKGLADPLQVFLGFLISLPLALNVDNWKPAMEAWGSITIWLVSCGMVALALSRLKSQPINLRQTFSGFDRSDFYLAVGLVVAALLVRVPDIETIPYYVDPDEASLARAALDSLTRVNTDPFTTGWATHPTLQFFVHALFIDVLGRTFLAMRLPSAIAGALAVAGLYLVARVGFGRRVGLLAGVLAVASDVGIHFSRLGINNITDSLFAPLVVGCLWLAGLTGRAWGFVLTGLFLGLSQYYYFGSRALPFVVAACVLLWLIADWRGVFRGWRLILSLFLVALVVTEPLIGHFAQFPGSLSEHLSLTVPFTSRLAAEAASLRLTLLGAWEHRILDSLLVFTVIPDRASFFNSGQPLLHPIEAPFFLLGVLAIFARWRQPVNQAVVIWTVVILTLGSILMDVPDAFHRLLGVLPAGLLITAIGLNASVEKLTNLVRLSPATSARLAAVVVMIFAVVDMSFYFGVYTNHIPDRNPSLAGADIAALEYEQIHKPGDTFVIYSSDSVDPKGVVVSQPILYVAGSSFL
jgi:4-amino-4-deoxy-L-arabinose transferase-like glycosyltransferase